MDGQVDEQPDHLCIAQKPDPETYSGPDHYRKNQCVGLNSESVSQDRPGYQRDENGYRIPDRYVWKEVPILAHEEVSAIGASFGCVEVTLEELSSFTNRTT